MTLKEIYNAILSALKADAEALGVDENNINGGKPGEIPSEAPFLMLFGAPAEPGDSEKLGGALTATFEIYAGVDNPVLAEGIFQSLELAESAFNIARKAATVRGVSFRYDAIYNGYCVSYASFSVSYKLSV